MKKLLKPLTALFLALIISGCSSAPDTVSGGLVSADFVTSQSTDIPATQNDSSKEDLTPEEKSAKAFEKLLSLGNGIAICNTDDNVEYSGGVIELSCNIEYSCNSEEAFADVSTGCLIAINGVLQKISCGEQKDRYMYVQTYEKDDFIQKDGQYVANKTISLSFEPQINEKDKDLTELQLTVISVDNPLFRLQPEWPLGFYIHRTGTSHVLKMTLTSPITNYTKDIISEDGFTELDLTDEVAEKYGTMVNADKKSLTENTLPFANVDSENSPHFCFDENGKINLGFVTSVSEDGNFNYEISSQGRYLISMFINGSPHTFPDGSMYKSIDMIPGKLYVYEAEDFSGILGECDTIAFLPVACLREDGKCNMSTTVQARAIVPKDKAVIETQE